ncbi:glycosyltransferase family 4 protein [Nostoc sphaeroides]|uniref:glycosyltransferase family 4 protein n=1 Tax=Nostoc sphaeroides TaxID=446679 RepID=UPI00126A2AD0|nr:glycosyltransferase family 4 protein [Nostoc sphaeroides]
MKPLLINTNDTNGGAARAAYRLHKGLQKIGIASKMLVQNKQSDDYTVIAMQDKLSKGIAKLKPTLDALPLQIYHQRDGSLYSLQWLPDTVTKKVAELNPDIINLHWINGGYLQIENIAKLDKPIVWTLHDMWAFTGGCHIAGDCLNYTKSCGACYRLHSHKQQDISRWVWWRKTKAWQDLNLTIVTPSVWLAKCAAASSLFKDRRIEVIANGLDTNKYKPVNKSIARAVLGLPEDKQLILFGAMNATTDHNKGFHLLQSALDNLSKAGWAERIELVVFGVSEPKNTPQLGFKSHYLGRLNDDISLALVYSAADVMIVPSIQEAFGQTASESLACGTPVVCFDSTGLKDIVEHQKNGYRAKCFSSDDLATGIIWVIENQERYQKLCDKAFETVNKKFTLDLQAKRYLSLYEEILDKKFPDKLVAKFSL